METKCTLHVRNLSSEVTEDLLWELGTQFGAVQSVSMPCDRESGERFDYAFIQFRTQADADYCNQVLSSSNVKLFGRALHVSLRARTAPLYSGTGVGLIECGAKLFVRNIDRSVDEDALAQLFGRFGRLAVPPKILRDEHNESKGVGFVSFDSFEASDAALAALNGNAFQGRILVVEYAIRPDGKGRHGSAEEREAFAAIHQLSVAQREEQERILESVPHVDTPTPSASPAWAAGVDPYLTKKLSGR